MKGALVMFIAKVEGMVKEEFSGAEPQTPTIFCPPPPIKIPGGANGTMCFSACLEMLVQIQVYKN